MKPGLHRPQRKATLPCDFALAQSSEECEVDDLSLSFWKKLNHAPEQSRQIAILQVACRRGDLVNQGVVNVVFEALSRATVRRPSTQTIQCTPARKSHQEPAKPPFVRIVSISLLPDLKQNIVKNVIDLGFIAYNAQNDSTEQRFVSHIDTF